MQTIILISLFLLIFSCTSNQLTMVDSYNKSVIVTLNDGKLVEGLIIEAKSDAIIIIEKKTEIAQTFESSRIRSINLSEKFFDDGGLEIKEEQFNAEKNSTYKLAYSLIGSLGGALVGGFIGLNIDKGLQTDSLSSSSAGIIGLISGMLTGAYFGFEKGNQSDILFAIDRIRIRRSALRKYLLEKNKN